ncbi:MAG: hypothetical protein ACUVV6_03470 [Thermoplasmatota archaeon]
MRAKLGALASFLVCLLLTVPSTAALPPSEWKAGREKDITGHSFDEEYWTCDNITNTTEDGLEASFSLSYCNYKDVQAFLVALNTIKKNATVGTLPWQLFGLHYYTKGGTENFLTAVLAFLLAYNDTNGNGMPDHGNEPTYYVIPFGVSDALKNLSEDFAPEVSVLPVEKLGDGHYRFGMRYRNLYAKIIDANNIVSLLLSAALPIYIARFSELTVTYDVTIDPESGVAKAETFYTLGQVQRLWLWGQNVGREALPESFGIAAVHYVAIFAKKYEFSGSASGTRVTAGVNKPVDENLTLKIGKDDRAMEIGYRGTFDLKDEATDTYIERDKRAYNMLVAARPGDLWLIQWQAGFSLDVLCLMAYGLSKSMQEKYKSPLDLYIKGRQDFWGAALWYGVAFPSWRGYRAEHDPTYTAFFGPEPSEAAKEPCRSAILVGGVLLLAAPAVVAARRRELIGG